MSNPPCPDEDALLSLVLGDPEDEGIASHAETCPDCRERSTELRRELTLLREAAARLGRPDAEEPLPSHPSTIGKYFVVGKVGEGGQAVVYRAVHPHLGTDLVIKLSRQPVDRSRRDDDLIVAEAKLLAGLEHPNLVRVFDLDFHEDRPYFVMEHVRGCTLEQQARDEKPTPQQAASLVAAVARAVAVAHRRGILHQDIKPNNILIDESGKPRLTDFGIAHLRDAWQSADLQPVGGTPGFMAPEQAKGDSRQISPRTDVFALGGVLYFLLTGEAPFAQADPDRAMEQTERGHLDLTPLDRAGVPRALAAVCRRALAPDPAHRYASADRLADDLEHFLRRPLRLKRLGLAVAIGLFLAGVVWFLWNWTGPPPIPEGPQDLIHLEGLALGAAVPLRRDHTFYIECFLPRRSSAALFLLDTTGEVTTFPDAAIKPGDRFDRLMYPADDRSLKVNGPAGTNLFLVCASGRASAVEPMRVRPLLEPLRGWPPLPDGVFLRFDRNKVEMVVGPCGVDVNLRGVDVNAQTATSVVRARLEELQTRLREEYEFFTGVAFPQQDASPFPGSMLVTRSAGQEPDAKPKKEAAVQLLRSLYAAVEAKDYDKALAYLQTPPGAKPEELKKACAGLIEKQEISKKGIDILAKDGKWGKLAEVFEANRAEGWAKRFNVPLADCYGLGLRNAEAGFYWNGKQFKIIRCDDIGKLE